ncbi:hypothetical protein HDK64DRAFT_249284 [Phyllosticta capitalensis]
MLYNAEKLKGLKQEGLRHAPLSTTTPPYTHRNFYPEHIRSMQLAKLWPSILCLVAAIAIYHFWRTIDEEKMVAIQRRHNVRRLFSTWSVVAAGIQDLKMHMRAGGLHGNGRRAQSVDCEASKGKCGGPSVSPGESEEGLSSRSAEVQYRSRFLLDEDHFYPTEVIWGAFSQGVCVDTSEESLAKERWSASSEQDDF